MKKLEIGLEGDIFRNIIFNQKGYPMKYRKGCQITAEMQFCSNDLRVGFLWVEGGLTKQLADEYISRSGLKVVLAERMSDEMFRIYFLGDLRTLKAKTTLWV